MQFASVSPLHWQDLDPLGGQVGIRTGRLTFALLLSLLFHTLLLSLTFGNQELGLPGFGFFWRERRGEAPNLRVKLMPAQVTAAAPAATPVREPPPQAAIAAQPKPVARIPPPQATETTVATKATEAIVIATNHSDEAALAVPAAPVPVVAVAPTHIEPELAKPAVEAPKLDLPQREPPEDQLKTVQLAAQRQEAARLEAAHVEAARLEAERQAAAQQATQLEAERQEAARLEAARIEAARLETERQAAAQQAAQLEAERQEAVHHEAMRLETARLAAEQAEEAKREARLRAIGRQLDEEAAQREAAATAARSPGMLPLSLSTARRVRLWGRADPNEDLVQYAEAWARKIQLGTPVESVPEATKRPHTNPMVTVAIRSDGSVEAVTIVLSSGVPEIDEAIRRIVQSHAPYQAFSPGLARQYDIVEVRRTWHFDVAIRLY